MAIATAPRTNSAATGNAIYFRELFASNPKWATEPNKDVLAQWQLDHPGQSVTASVRTALSKSKAGMRTGRKRGRGGRRAGTRATPTMMATVQATPGGMLTASIPDVPACFPVQMAGLTINRTELKGVPVLEIKLRG